jgi:hypothetical protein
MAPYFANAARRPAGALRRTEGLIPRPGGLLVTLSGRLAQGGLRPPEAAPGAPGSPAASAALLIKTEEAMEQMMTSALAAAKAVPEGMIDSR